MTETEICNLALLHLGQSIIADLETEKSRPAELCRVLYAQSRDSLLRSFPWNFARRRVTLALQGAPPGVWGYSYALPSDCLQALALTLPGVRIPRRDQAVPFELGTDGVQTLILTDQPEAELTYTSRVEDVWRFDSLFAETLSWLLAANLAMPLSIKPDLAQSARQTYSLTLSQAAAQSQNEGWAGPEPECDFLSVRGVSSSRWGNTDGY